MWQLPSLRLTRTVIFLISYGIVNFACSAPLVHIGASSYSILGQSSLILSAEMRAKGPLGDDGRRHPAKTKWDLQWRFKHKELSARCGVDSVQVSLGITHTKPVWRNKSDASQSLIDRWDKFERALLAIQRQHEDLAMRAAQEIEDSVLDVTPQKTCEELETMVGAIVRNLKEKYRALKIDYESSTDYGRRMGLSLM
ncbi:DUF922 domain-containing Zn-dependent protease [Burkholderiales bacterium]|nr:DUF922 domain-containing Zn-dependent protease [Burkholderiales bacterium]